MQLYDRAPTGVPSLEDFPHWHECCTVEPRQWKKGYFYEFLARDAFRANEVQVQGNVMQMFAGHVTSRRSRNESSKMRERGNRDGDKLLCNRCPLNHEARERERGEMIYENISNRKHSHQKTCVEKYN